MANPLLKKQAGKKLFPRQQVETCLLNSLAEEAQNQNILGISDNPLEPVLDSLVVVGLLVNVENILGWKVPETVVKRGGYYCVEEAIQDLLQKIERFWLDEI